VVKEENSPQKSARLNGKKKPELLMEQIDEEDNTLAGGQVRCSDIGPKKFV
jgi:hypothetical protein